jgi:heme exporter protein B
VSGTGFLATLGRIAVKDLRLEWRTWEATSATLVFAVIVLVIFNFAFGLAAAERLGPALLVPGAIWTVIAFASVVGMVRSFQLERRRESLTALYVAPIDRGAIWAGKTVANLAKLTLLELVLLVLTALVFGIDLSPSLAPLGFVLALHGIGLAELGTLFAGITTKLGRGEALLATLLFPAAAPLLISAVQCTAACLSEPGLGAASDWLLLATGFDLLYAFVGLLTFELVLEE